MGALFLVHHWALHPHPHPQGRWSIPFEGSAYVPFSLRNLGSPDFCVRCMWGRIFPKPAWTLNTWESERTTNFSQPFSSICQPWASTDLNPLSPCVIPHSHFPFLPSTTFGWMDICDASCFVCYFFLLWITYMSTYIASKFGKLSIGHRIEKAQFSFQSKERYTGKVML